MRGRPIRCRGALLALVALLLWSGACAVSRDGAAEVLRASTYPPDFRYISAEQLKSTMESMAYHIAELERRLADPSPDPEAVVALLRAIDGSAATLGPGGWPSNHPRVSRNIEGFRDRVAAARVAAGGAPPSFHLARTLADSCTNCHRGSP